MTCFYIQSITFNQYACLTVFHKNKHAVRIGSVTHSSSCSTRSWRTKIQQCVCIFLHFRHYWTCRRSLPHRWQTKFPTDTLHCMSKHISVLQDFRIRLTFNALHVECLFWKALCYIQSSTTRLNCCYSWKRTWQFADFWESDVSQWEHLSQEACLKTPYPTRCALSRKPQRNKH